MPIKENKYNWYSKQCVKISINKITVTLAIQKHRIALLLFVFNKVIT